MTPGDRLRQFRYAAKIPQMELAHKVNYNVVSISYIELNRRNLDTILADTLSHTYNLSKTWLLNGEGDMYNT